MGLDSFRLFFMHLKIKKISKVIMEKNHFGLRIYKEAHNETK